MVRMQYEMSHHTGKVLTNFLISIFAENSDLQFFIMDGGFCSKLLLHHWCNMFSDYPSQRPHLVYQLHPILDRFCWYCFFFGFCVDMIRGTFSNVPILLSMVCLVGVAHIMNLYSILFKTVYQNFSHMCMIKLGFSPFVWIQVGLELDNI